MFQGEPFVDDGRLGHEGNIMSLTRRAIVRAGVGAAALTMPVVHGPWRFNSAFAQNKPIKVGLTCDASGQYAASGRDDLRGIRMAIDEVNARGGVLGRRIEWIAADTETNPETGSRVAERFVLQEDCAFLIGAVHSGVAHAITQVADRSGVIYLNTNSSAPSEARENCSRIKFVWDANGTNFAKAAVTSAIKMFGTRCLLLTNDYEWGRQASAATRTLMLANGGRITGELMVPPNTRDFTLYLRKIRDLKPDMVATAVGGDDFKALRDQVVKAKLDTKPAWISSQQDWPDIWGSPDSLFGVFGTTWYHKLKLPGVPEFVRKWQVANGDGPIPVPGNVSYNGYMATRELFNAIERAGSTNNIKIIYQLEGLKIPAKDRMQHFDAYMNPNTHQMQQTIYLARRNPKPSDPTDYFEIVSWAEPKTLEDPAAPDLCRLIPHEQVPMVDS
jgi:branched-chain amino acid transport system substrate-binding protein